MFKGKTNTGFSFEISDSALNNMELIDAIADAEDGNVLSMSAVSRLLLGSDQKKRLYDHVRLEDGTIPAEAFSAELISIFNEMGNVGKN